MADYDVFNFLVFFPVLFTEAPFETQFASRLESDFRYTCIVDILKNENYYVFKNLYLKTKNIIFMNK